MSWKVSGQAGCFCPSLKLKLWVCVFMARAPLRFISCMDFDGMGVFCMIFQVVGQVFGLQDADKVFGVLDAGLDSVEQNSGLASDVVEGFHQR